MGPVLVVCPCCEKIAVIVSDTIQPNYFFSMHEGLAWLGVNRELFDSSDFFRLQIEIQVCALPLLPPEASLRTNPSQHQALAELIAFALAPLGNDEPVQ